jgi:hypothetical protein
MEWTSVRWEGALRSLGSTVTGTHLIGIVIFPNDSQNQ